MTSSRERSASGKRQRSAKFSANSTSRGNSRSLPCKTMRWPTGSHDQVEPVIGGDDIDPMTVAAQLLEPHRLAVDRFDHAVVIGGLMVKQNQPLDLRRLRQFDR